MEHNPKSILSSLLLLPSELQLYIAQCLSYTCQSAIGNAPKDTTFGTICCSQAECNPVVYTFAEACDKVEALNKRGSKALAEAQQDHSRRLQSLTFGLSSEEHDIVEQQLWGKGHFIGERLTVLYSLTDPYIKAFYYQITRKEQHQSGSDSFKASLDFGQDLKLHLAYLNACLPTFTNSWTLHTYHVPAICEDGSTVFHREGLIKALPRGRSKSAFSTRVQVEILSQPAAACTSKEAGTHPSKRMIPWELASTSFMHFTHEVDMSDFYRSILKEIKTEEDSAESSKTQAVDYLAGNLAEVILYCDSLHCSVPHHTLTILGTDQDFLLKTHQEMVKITQNPEITLAMWDMTGLDGTLTCCSETSVCVQSMRKGYLAGRVDSGAAHNIAMLPDRLPLI